VSTTLPAPPGAPEAAATPLDPARQELVDFVLEQTGSPIDVWAVAATLESRGLRDVDARERFGEKDVFDLAEQLYAACRAQLHASPARDERQDRMSLTRRLARFGRFYLRGMFFAAPMVIQIASVLVLGFGLWSFLYFDERQATAVAIGTILSFVATGGFVQAIGRLGLFYSEQQSHILAMRVSYRLIRVGMLAAVALGLVWLGISVLSPQFPLDFVLVAVVYHLLLSALWLFMAVLYTLQLRLAIVGASIVGVAVIAVVLTIAPGVGIYVAHWIGMGASNVFAWAWGRRVYRRRAAGVSGSTELAKLPRDAILAYSVAPYFAYGILYFGFLFLDRLMAWSADDLQYLVVFRTPYELGLDWALLSLIPTIALLEYTINEFSALIIPVQKRFSAFDLEGHNRYFQRFYRRQLTLLAAMAAASVVLTFNAVLWLRRFEESRQVRDFFADPITYEVYFLGAVGYALLVWGLMNGVLFFSLSRPFFVLRPLALGVAGGTAVGFLLSRTVEYWTAAAGLVVGAAIFAGLTARHVSRVLRDLDYYYYSAY
jgi:small-conductance mechanosensitive channel